MSSTLLPRSRVRHRHRSDRHGRRPPGEAGMGRPAARTWPNRRSSRPALTDDGTRLVDAAEGTFAAGLAELIVARTTVTRRRPPPSPSWSRSALERNQMGTPTGRAGRRTRARRWTWSPRASRSCSARSPDTSLRPGHHLVPCQGSSDSSRRARDVGSAAAVQAGAGRRLTCSAADGFAQVVEADFPEEAPAELRGARARPPGRVGSGEIEFPSGRRTAFMWHGRREGRCDVRDDAAPRGQVCEEPRRRRR